MKTESVLKFYFYPVTIDYYVPHYFSAVDTRDIFRTTSVKYGAICYRKDKHFCDTMLFDAKAISDLLT